MCSHLHLAIWRQKLCQLRESTIVNKTNACASAEKLLLLLLQLQLLHFGHVVAVAVIVVVTVAKVRLSQRQVAKMLWAGKSETR